MGLDMKALREKAKQRNANKPNTFTPMDLNEGNVQAIFERCLATEDSKDSTDARLFPSVLGWDIGAETPIRFDTAELLKNKKVIQYLFGQLQEVHAYSKTLKKQDVTIDDCNTTYSGTCWTRDKGTLLKFLYLGVAPETLFISHFHADSKTSLISPQVTPTLSPKDPAFPEWWERHKAEWEG